MRLVALQKITQSHPSAVQPALEINVCVCPPSWVKCSPLESQEHSAYQGTVANRVEGAVFDISFKQPQIFKRRMNLDQNTSNRVNVQTWYFYPNF